MDLLSDQKYLRTCAYPLHPHSSRSDTEEYLLALASKKKSSRTAVPMWQLYIDQVSTVLAADYEAQ